MSSKNEADDPQGLAHGGEKLSWSFDSSWKKAIIYEGDGRERSTGVGLPGESTLATPRNGTRKASTLELPLREGEKLDH